MHQRTLSLVSSLAILAGGLVAGHAASAQELAIDDVPAVEAAPAPAVQRRRPVARAATRPVSRPLTVTRRAAPPPAFIEPGPAREFAGPAAYAVAPIQLASNIADLPFRALGTVFPPTGDPEQNVLVVVGLPLHAVGRLVQVPFQLVEAPFRADAPPLF